MHLTGKACVAAGLIKDHVGGKTRAASYDLSVGSIIVAGKEHERQLAIAPQQMVILVSRETVSVGPGYVGYAMPKTGLCQQGILALNTGLIDPGYEGRISTVAVNFDKEAVPIRPGDSFLRLVFHKLDQIDAESAVDSAVGQTPEAYMTERRSESERYPRTFMDVPGQTEELTKAVSTEVLGAWTKQLLTLVGVLTFAFLLWNLGAYVIFSRQSTSAIEQLLQADRGNDRLRDLEVRLRVLEAERAGARPTGASVNPQSPPVSPPRQ